MKSLFALIHARNKEFIRDRSALGWSLLFPFILIVALAVIFDNDDSASFRVGTVGEPTSAALLKDVPHLAWIPYSDIATGEAALSKFKVDVLLTADGLMVNQQNKNSDFLEALLLAKQPELIVSQVSGRSISHVEWYLPGILSMNMMFSALFGVGYVVIRYRRTGVLKRLQVTPLTRLEFVMSQLLSRLCAILLSTALVFIIISLMFDIKVQGSLGTLWLSATLGTAAMISLGLLVASRTRSDEMGNGVMNLLSWPMMMLSGIWFSLDGSDKWLQILANCLPLTQMNQANRAIITDGATLIDVMPELGFLTLFTLLCSSLTALLFKWD